MASARADGIVPSERRRSHVRQSGLAAWICSRRRWSWHRSSSWPFLVHVTGGFYAIGHTANLVGGFAACPLQFDRARYQFFCPNTARWDRVGRVLVNPDADRFRDDPLMIFDTEISHDGHVLVSTNSYRHATAELARELWPAK